MANVCRMCLQVDGLIEPCDCDGILAYTHPSCLENWIESTNIDYCDICHFKYNLYRQHKGFVDFVKSNEEDFIDIFIILCGIIFILYTAFIGYIVTLVVEDTINYLLIQFLRFWGHLWIICLFIVSILIIYRIIKLFNEWKSSHFNVNVYPNAKTNSYISADIADISSLESILMDTIE